MKKNIIPILLSIMGFAIKVQAQNPRPDTLGMAVLNTARNFTLSTAEFGGVITQTLIGDMVRIYDTVIVYKETNKSDSLGRKIKRYEEERRCNTITKNVKDKIGVIELNNDCDVTVTCLNAQRAGATALIIIHNGNDKKVIKLAKKGLYIDSIRIPIFTLPNKDGEKVLELLPSKIGIVLPTPPIQSLANNNILDLEAQAQVDKTQLDWVTNTGEQNDYFIVQKQNPITGVFEDLNKVDNQNGNSNLERHTTFDFKPDEGDNIYRIKLVQLDGTIRYSDNKTVTFNSNDNISLFPNPTKGEINISFKGYKGQSADITIYDMQGKLVFNSQIDNIYTSVNTFNIDNKVASGQFMLRVRMAGKKDVLKFFEVSK